ncbi:hypothetical protein G6F55_011868 [Rhizopus delemar]|uniref:Uncharacterized protein n=3 Tax=Rhizopus TaxID=4842 RepID=I1CMY3_RHIO9|nr:hypothetical protein RO3G_14524 [Rhizopus delemar RA 99-880]KAG1445648.1 hypothetical protein G6F55_011868 [Rhizopus delemar]KAG1534502.1 hypothetical protein G6F51_012063 [Rhizopus arrhizus]KAG1491184.1 hypothetical protein G6F54_010197 [Rhizopus delemar]KAG1498578.1 hypothetical protein G6F53_011713 [Rhizopus delemar]|eukprot:EIE89813.1 hypothetical protein RO3G_14524 [Rhizopus delemar RA 99-880]
MFLDLCFYLFFNCFYYFTTTLGYVAKFVWDHILQEPSSLVTNIHTELPLLTKVRLSTRWSRFTPQAYRLAFQDVHIRVLISFKKLRFITSGTANPIPMLEQCSTGLFIIAFPLKSSSTSTTLKSPHVVLSVVQRMILSDTLQSIVPRSGRFGQRYYTSSFRITLSLLKWFMMCSAISPRAVLCSIIGTTHWQLWNLYWNHGNSNSRIVSPTTLEQVYAKTISLIDILLHQD